MGRKSKGGTHKDREVGYFPFPWDEITKATEDAYLSSRRAIPDAGVW